MLILFDIDATLITTHRSGIAAMERAGRGLFGPSFTVEKTDFAGRLDPLILADLLRDNGLEVSPANLAALRAGYRTHLPGILRERAAHCKTCPGIPDLLEALRPHTERSGGVTLGLLTGNFPDTGAIKLAACGIDIERFVIRVWGDESPHEPPARDHLPEIGLRRYRERISPELEARHAPLATIIGDTPHDIACARAHGLRSLGVATGIHTVAQLEAAGADLALPNLADTARVLEWLIGAGGGR